MNFKNSMIPVVVGVSIAGGAALGMLYLLFKKDDDVEIFGGSRRGIGGVTSSRATTIKMSIAKDVVGIVIGRGGSNIREIQEKTKTKINFKDECETDTQRTCCITGSAENAQLAESMIYHIIRNQPLITTSDISVPVRACGRIIGRNGENIRAITQQSGAKVTVDNSGGKSTKFGDRRITLKGTAEQIAVAKSLIDEKVVEDTKLRQECNAGASVRTPRGNNKSPQYIMPAGLNQAEREVSNYHDSRLTPSSSDRLMEVYVSAVESPNRFWVQMVSPSSVELDQLLEQMTEHYSKEENQELHVIEDLEIGQQVAAPFLADGKWYRAFVVSIDVNEYAPKKTLVELYYVDYGDTYDMPRSTVLELRPDFLKLPFQGIECALAKVKPSTGPDWTEEAIDLFEMLTYNAKWKVLMCSVDHYDPDKVRRQDRGRREGSPVPVVNLFDISGAKDINVAEELVKNKFAVYSHVKRTDKPSDRREDSFGRTSASTSTNGTSGDVSPSTSAMPRTFDPTPTRDTSSGADASPTTPKVTPPSRVLDDSPILVGSRVAANFGQRRATDNGGGDVSANRRSKYNSSSATGETGFEDRRAVDSDEVEVISNRKPIDHNAMFKVVNQGQLGDDFELY